MHRACGVLDEALHEDVVADRNPSHRHGAGYGCGAVAFVADHGEQGPAALDELHSLRPVAGRNQTDDCRCRRHRQIDDGQTIRALETHDRYGHSVEDGCVEYLGFGSAAVAAVVGVDTESGSGIVQALAGVTHEGSVVGAEHAHGPPAANTGADCTDAGVAFVSGDEVPDSADREHGDAVGLAQFGTDGGGHIPAARRHIHEVRRRTETERRDRLRCQVQLEHCVVLLQ